MYRKRYEDSYLDAEEDEFSGMNIKDADKVLFLVRKTVKGNTDRMLIEKLTDRLCVQSMLSGSMGTDAVEGLKSLVEAYGDMQMVKESTETLARILEVAERIGDRDLYYYATDKMLEMT
jgi:hypothetical protein